MERQATVIQCARVLAGACLTVFDDAVVVLSDSRISAVGAREDVELPEPNTTVDASGMTLIPGFIDAHVHIGFYPPHDVVVGGVTTARDLGWPPQVIHRLAQLSRATDFDGPTIVAAGPILTCPGGYPTRAPWAPMGTGREVEGPEAAGGAVERTADEGAAVIKVALNDAAGPTFDAPTLRAIVDAAHERGLKVTGHVHSIAELEKALEAGMDELAHMVMSRERLPESVIDEMVSRPMTVVPTTSIRFGAERRLAIDNLRRFAEAGGRVVYGTDLGNSGPRPGIDAREVDGMRSAGLALRDIIASATSVAATHIGLNTTGSIEPGKDADIVAVEGDPLRDQTALGRVAIVWRKGRRVT